MLGVSFKMGYDESKLFFLRTSFRFYSALAILEPQIYVVVEQQFGAENISLLSGSLVYNGIGPRKSFQRIICDLAFVLMLFERETIILICHFL